MIFLEKLRCVFEDVPSGGMQEQIAYIREQSIGESGEEALRAKAQLFLDALTRFFDRNEDVLGAIRDRSWALGKRIGNLGLAARRAALSEGMITSVELRDYVNGLPLDEAFAALQQDGRGLQKSLKSDIVALLKHVDVVLKSSVAGGDRAGLVAALNQVYTAAIDIVARLEKVRFLTHALARKMGTLKATRSEIEKAISSPEYQARKQYRQQPIANAPEAAAGKPAETKPAEQPEKKLDRLAAGLRDMGVTADLAYRRAAIQQALAAKPNASDDEAIADAFEKSRKQQINVPGQEAEEPWKAKLRRHLRMT